jgi:O-antigen/teichoic acid export membrane protein
MHFGKNIIIYAISIVLQAGLSFLLVSILSHKLTIKEFGDYNLYLTINAFAFSFMIVGVDGAIGLFYHKVNRLKYKLYISNGIIFILPLGLLFVIVLYNIFDTLLIDKFHLNSNILKYLIIILFFQSTTQILLSYYQTQQKALNYAFLNISFLLFNFISALLFISLFKELEYLYIGMMISTFIFFLYSIVYFIKHKLLFFRFNKIIFKELLHYGVVLIPNAIGSTIFFMSDRFFVSYYYDNEMVAYYSIAIQIGMFILIFNNAFVKAWNPFLFSKLKNFDENNRKVIKKLSIVFVLFFLTLPFIVDELKFFVFDIFFDEKLKDGLEYVFWIAVGYSFMGVFKVFSGYLFYLKKIKLISIISILSAILNLLLNYLFIKYFGVIGVAYATALTMFIFMIVVFLFVQKYYKVFM